MYRNSQHLAGSEYREQLVEGVFPHLPRGEGQHRGQVGHQPEHPEQPEEDSLAPELVPLPNLESKCGVIVQIVPGPGQSPNESRTRFWVELMFKVERKLH